MKPTEIYASMILHSGCAINGGKHTWSQCPDQRFFMRIARKHQHKLQSAGYTVGIWIKDTSTRGRFPSSNLQDDDYAD